MPKNNQSIDMYVQSVELGEGKNIGTAVGGGDSASLFNNDFCSPVAFKGQSLD